MSLPLNQVILGDCGDVMAEWPGNSVDCVVTDPPYRIGFMGSSWDRALPPRRAFRQIFRVLKPGALAFIMSSPRQDVLWRMMSMLEEIGFELRQSFISWIYKTGFPKAFDVSKGIDRKLGKDREVIGKQLTPFKVDKTKERSVALEGSVSGDFSKQVDEKGYRYTEITKPVSRDAKLWSGWKSQTGLKPALECILMVNKPRSEPTIVDNVLRWGTGAVNVDACRIPYQSEEDYDELKAKANLISSESSIIYGSKGIGGKGHLLEFGNIKGRFPANLLISDGALDTGETTKSGKLELHHNISEDRNIYGEYKGRNQISSYGDEGNPYRYFDLDAWAEHHGFLDVAKPSRAERDFGLGAFPIQEVKTHGEMAPDLTGKSHNTTGQRPAKRRNIHATVKPVKLMAYLIELGCPPKGIVVDPFLGSGTTCIAANRLRRKWIGIEINPEYAEIAEARINIRGPLDQFMEADADSTS